MKKQYFQKSVKSLGHTPIYKMHKYFARRPHNVFAALIEHYSDKGDIIFDPFGGGGVSLIEGLTLGRRVAISDVNPIASFIQYCQISEVDSAKILKLAARVSKDVKKLFPQSFTTQCLSCKKQDAHVRWIEHAYEVICPDCNKVTALSNDNKAVREDGSPVNGLYKCTHCESSIKAANIKRAGSQLLSLRYKCSACGAHENKTPDENDIKQFEYFNKNYKSIVESNSLFIPDDEIPTEWDRQQEDCLHRKGFNKFSDLFTRRNLIICAALFYKIKEMREAEEINEREHDFLFFIISSLLRYTNNMNFSTSSWMDGRPVAWAKHAYWTPNQYIEVNPFEYLQNRAKAVKSGLNDQKARFSGQKIAKDFKDLLKGNADYLIRCQDSATVDIPDNSVDLVITDPPYGSNVQYGELCYFWQVWLQGKTYFPIENINFNSEAVVHRKTKHKSYQKSFDSYETLLKKVFSKCFRVLKSDGVLVFTFNNKDIRAWYSVIKAALDAGFHLEPDGIFYQEPIDAYRDTAHLRFEGTPQGDFVYTFKKTAVKNETDYDGNFEICLKQTVQEFESQNKKITSGDFVVRLFANSALCLVNQIKKGLSCSQIEDEFKKISNSKILSAYKHLDERAEAA